MDFVSYSFVNRFSNYTATNVAKDWESGCERLVFFLVFQTELDPEGAKGLGNGTVFLFHALLCETWGRRGF